MAEGIMGLAPGMGAPQGGMPPAPPQMDPAMRQQSMDAFFNQEPQQVENAADEVVAEDPQLAQELQQILSSMALTDEVKEALLLVVNTILEYPGDYADLRQELLSIGFPEELLPEELDVQFFTTLRFALMRAPSATPVQKFKDGGPVSLKPVAKFLQSQGRNGDTILAHINPQEAALLKSLGGSGTINPVTGLREYFLKKAWNSVKKAVTKVVTPVVKAVKAIAKPIVDGTKKLLANPIVRSLATVAAVVYLGPMASNALASVGLTTGATTGLMGALNTGLGATIASTGVNLLAGEKPSDALKNGLKVGATAGVAQYGIETVSNFFTPAAPAVEGVSNLQPTGGVGTTGGTGNVGDVLKPGAEIRTMGDLRNMQNAANLQANAAGGAGAGGAGAGGAGAGSTSMLGKAYDVAAGLVKNPYVAAGLGALGTAAVLGGQEEPPSPEDLEGIPTETGMELLEQNPSKYGVRVGEIGTTYSQLSPDQMTSPSGTSLQSMPFGTVEDISLGAPITTGLTPGVTPSLPSTSTPYVLPTPDFSKVQPSTSFTVGSSGLSPTLQDQLDPNSPYYNPFAAQVASMAPAPVQSFAQGGIATVQGYAKGGSADARLKAQAQAMLDRQRQQATVSRRKEEAARKGPVVSGVGYKSPSATKTPAQIRAASQQAERERYAQQQADIQKYQAQQEAKRQAAARQEAARQEMQRQEAARLATAEAARQEAARLAAEEAARQEAGRQAEIARVNQGVAQFRDMYASGATPTIEDPSIASALEADRAANPMAYMTPAQLQEIEQQKAFEAEMARIAEQRRMFEQEQAALAAQRARQEELARAAAEFEQYQSSFVAPPEPVPSAVDNPPVSAPVALPASEPTVPPVNITAGGIGSTAPNVGTIAAPVQVPVTPGITSPTAPSFTAPTFGFGLGPGTMDQSNPFLYTGGGTGASSFNAPAVGFAQGGIAAMAPSRFKRGSSSNGVTNFPRKVGPINGPGTGTSDSIPAMLSDGEFVFTAKAVRNFGNGSRREGAKKMYQMMKALERKA